MRMHLDAKLQSLDQSQMLVMLLNNGEIFKGHVK